MWYHSSEENPCGSSCKNIKGIDSNSGRTLKNKMDYRGFTASETFILRTEIGEATQKLCRVSIISYFLCHFLLFSKSSATHLSRYENGYFPTADVKLSQIIDKIPKSLTIRTPHEFFGWRLVRVSSNSFSRDYYFLSQCSGIIWFPSCTCNWHCNYSKLFMFFTSILHYVKILCS